MSKWFRWKPNVRLLKRRFSLSSRFCFGFTGKTHHYTKRNRNGLPASALSSHQILIFLWVQTKCTLLKETKRDDQMCALSWTERNAWDSYKEPKLLAMKILNRNKCFTFSVFLELLNLFLSGMLRQECGDGKVGEVGLTQMWHSDWWSWPKWSTFLFNFSFLLIHYSFIININKINEALRMCGHPAPWCSECRF